MKRPLKQSGYNLVEIALVLAIVLMISSLLAVKYYQVQRDARNAETARSIGLIKEAIMDYAAANGARSRIIVMPTQRRMCNGACPPEDLICRAPI